MKKLINVILGTILGLVGLVGFIIIIIAIAIGASMVVGIEIMQGKSDDNTGVHNEANKKS